MMARNRPNHSPIVNSPQKKLLVSLLIIFIAVVCFVVGIFSGTRYLVSGPRFKHLVISRLQGQVNGRISIEKLDLKWTSLTSGLIESSGIRVGEATSDPLEIALSKLEMSFDLREILLGKLEIDFIRIIKPIIIADLTLIKSIVSGSAPQNRITFFLNPTVKSLRIINGSVLNKKPGGPTKNYETLFSRVECSAGNLTLRGVERFEAHGASHEGPRTGRMEVSGNLETGSNADENERRKSFIKFRLLDYPTFPVSHLINSFFPKIPSFKAIADANIQIIGDWEEWKAKGSLEINSQASPNSKGHTRASHDRVTAGIEAFRKADRLTVSIPSFSAPGVEASLDADLSDIGSEKAIARVNVRKADINLDEAIRVAPIKLLSTVDQERILKAGIKGKIRILSASWNYRFEAKDKPKSLLSDLVIDAALNQVTAFIPFLELPIENTSGSFRLNANEALFKGINITIGSSPIVINGWLSHLSTKPKLDLFISMKAQASDLQYILSSKLWGDRFEPYLKWMQEPGGSVSVTMDLKGYLEKPSMKGQIDLEDFNFKTDSINLPLRKISGSLRFRPSSMSVSNMKGFVGDSPFEIKGVITDKESHANLELKINASDLKKTGLLGAGWSLAGTSPLSMNMKGRLPDIGFSGNLDLKNLVISKESWIKKPAGVPLEFEFSGIRNAEGLTVEDAYLVSDSGRVATRAQLKDNGRFSAALNLPPKGIPTSDLTCIVDPALELQPGGRIEGDVLIRKDRNQEPVFDANFVLNHVSLRLPRARKRTDGITGSIQLKGKTLQMTIERSKTGSSVIASDLLITDFSQPRYKAVFDCEFLDTTDFTDQSGQAPVMTWIDWIRSNSVIRFLNQSKGSISLKIAKGKTTYRSFSDFRAEFEGNGGLLSISKWQTGFADGILRGTGAIDIRPTTNRPLRIEFQGDQLNFDRIFISDPNRSKVDGTVVSQGYMDWRIRSGIENGGIYKPGSMEVRVADGTVYRFEILSKIFSLINLGSILRGKLPDVIGQGLTFQRMNWKMDVFDNKWKIKDLKFYSDAARIDASGMYFSDQGRVDFKVDVAPLVGFDTILSGLFGNLITKDGKILNTTFRVRGLTSSPDVRLEPFENLKQEFRQGG